MLKDSLLVEASKTTHIYRLKHEARGATELFLMPNALLIEQYISNTITSFVRYTTKRAFPTLIAITPPPLTVFMKMFFCT